MRTNGHAVFFQLYYCGGQTLLQRIVKGDETWGGGHSKLANTRVGPKVSGLSYKSRAKWKMLRGIYSDIYGEVNVSVSVCVEIKEDYIEK